jgi:FMN-dependent NADH-azoreductase
MNVLVLDSSLSGPESVSRQVLDEAVDELLAADPQATIVRRDLATDPIPHLTPANVAGVRAEPATAEEQAARALSDALIAELRAADLVLIGAPMYNFSIPSTLRTWIDHVLRARETFAYGPDGPRGLIGDRPVIVVEARGGAYSDPANAAADFQEPYLRFVLGFIGLKDLRFVRVERIGFGPEARAASISAATAEIREVAEAAAPVRAAA